MNDLGYEHEEVVGQMKLEELLTVGSRIFFQTHFYPLIKMQKKANEIFLAFLTKQKSDIPVLLNVVVADVEDTFEIHCGGMQISRRNQFEKELLEAKNIAQKALHENAELIAAKNELQIAERKLEFQIQKLSDKNVDEVELNKVLSHDLQEPLRKINLFSSKLLLEQDPDIKPESLEALRKITIFVDRVRQLLDSLKKFNSLNESQITYAIIDFKDIIETAKKNILAVGDEIAFVDNMSISKIDHEFKSDFKFLVSLFEELIKNAKRFDNQGNRELKINATVDVIKNDVFAKNKDRFRYEDCVRIVFEDNFSNYRSAATPFQLFSMSNLVADELGIGLTYCRRIVQMLGGDIAFSSKENIGTVFTIIFPFTHAIDQEA
ncbi:MAG: hypothetical protein EOO50_10995 [Flavobacterium sp.]|nr:MAG: hypothetical protein EOO50_10995 [Flavobacterium sp.]